ncbi:MAG: YfhO family protein [Acidobacteria bacterium]|nr:YfhO family protein [Acidobacteriota bacterium]
MSLLRRAVRIPRAPREYVAAVLGLLVLVLFLFRDVVFGGRVLFLRDVHLQWYGQVESLVHAVTSGSWPLWDPYVSFGQPLLANANAQVLYPPTWLNLLMRPWTYYTVFVLAHLLIAGTGLYALGRRFGLSPPGAFAAAAAWTASGPVLSLGNLWNHLGAAAWLPWALLAADVAVKSGRPRDVVLSGSALALQVLAGSPDVLAMTAALAAANALRHVDRRHIAGAVNRRVAAVLLGTFVFAAALSAGQALPSAELASRAGRFGLTAQERGYWSMHPLSMLQTAVRVSWTEIPLREGYREVVFESREPLLLSVYLGLPVLGLGLAAFAGPALPGRALFAWGAVTAVLLALGRHAPFYGLAAAVLPPLQVLRFPSKAMIAAALCLGLLAGMGVDVWRQNDAVRGRRWILRVTLPLATGMLFLGLAAQLASSRAAEWGPEVLHAPAAGSTYATVAAPITRALAEASVLSGTLALASLLRGRGARAGRAAGAAATVLAVADLLGAHADLNATAPRQLYTLRPDVLDHVAPQSDHRRLYVVDYQDDPRFSQRWLKRAVPYVVQTPDGQAPLLWRAALAARIYPAPPVAGAWRVHGSYARDLLRIQPPELRVLHGLLVRGHATPLFLRLLRLGAVSQVAALHDPPVGLEPEVTLPGPYFEPIRLFRVPDPLPRAYAVGGVRVANTSGEAVDVLLDPTFDPAREVILPSGRSQPPPASFRGAVRLLALKPDRVTLEADLESDGLVVLADAFDPGWRASVDGRDVPLLRANLAFRAVAVSAGRHVVEMAYRPRSVAAGLLLSAAAIVGGATLLLRPTRARPRPSGTDSAPFDRVAGRA